MVPKLTLTGSMYVDLWSHHPRDSTDSEALHAGDSSDNKYACFDPEYDSQSSVCRWMSSLPI